MMICYKESLQNLEKFSGAGTKKISQFINNIERIGRMIGANEEILYSMCTAKLDGEAQRWYEDNSSSTGWNDLKRALVERFSPIDSSSQIFEKLKERKQQPEESVTSYYDAVIQLCREYDPTMSQKLMISWLENGIKDSLKIEIKRQLRSLSETDKTTQAFLKIAKAEQELQQENLAEPESTPFYMPYIKNTVSTTLQSTHDRPHNSPLMRPTDSHSKDPFFRPTTTYYQSQQLPNTRASAHRPRQSTHQPRFPPTKLEKSEATSNRTLKALNHYDPCLICKRTNHRTIDCYHKKPNGCFKCGQSEHRVRDCPEVFQ
jgi:hypothetical protein